MESRGPSQHSTSHSITAPPGGPTSSSTTFTSATSSSSASTSSSLAPVAYSSQHPHRLAHSTSPSPTRAGDELRQRSASDSDAEREDHSPSFSLSSASNAAERENLSDREEQQQAAQDEQAAQQEEADETQPLLGSDVQREGTQWVDQDPKEVEDEAKNGEKTADSLNLHNQASSSSSSSQSAPAPVFKSKFAYLLRRSQRSDFITIVIMFYGMVCGLMMYGTIATVLPFMDEFDYVADLTKANDDNADLINVDEVSSAQTSAMVAETLALMGLGQILGSFFIGPLCDIPIIGRRWMFVVSQVVQAAAVLLFFSVTVSGQAWWDTIRLVQGLAAGAQEVSAQAVFLDLYAGRPAMIPIVFGVINMGLTVGYVSGPPLGGYLWQLYGRNALIALFAVTYTIEIFLRIVCVDDDYLTCVRTGLVQAGDMADITPELLRQARESEAHRQDAGGSAVVASAAEAAAQPAASGSGGQVVVGISSSSSSTVPAAAAPVQQPGVFSRMGKWIKNYLVNHYSLLPRLFTDMRFSLVMLGSGVMATNMALYDAIIPSYAKNRFGMASGMAGVITFIIVFPSILFALPAGIIASKVNKLPLAMSVLLFAALFSWLPVFTMDNLYAIVGLLATANFFCAFVRPALGAYVVRVVISHGFSNSLGQFAAINYCIASIFASAIPIIGGQIYKATQNFAMMLYLLAAMGLLMALLVLVCGLFSVTGWKDPEAQLEDSLKNNANAPLKGKEITPQLQKELPTTGQAPTADVQSKA